MWQRGHSDVRFTGPEPWKVSVSFAVRVYYRYKRNIIYLVLVFPCISVFINIHGGSYKFPRGDTVCVSSRTINQLSKWNKTGLIIVAILIKLLSVRERKPFLWATFFGNSITTIEQWVPRWKRAKVTCNVRHISFIIPASETNGWCV